MPKSEAYTPEEMEGIEGDLRYVVERIIVTTQIDVATLRAERCYAMYTDRTLPSPDRKKAKTEWIYQRNRATAARSAYLREWGTLLSPSEELIDLAARYDICHRHFLRAKHAEQFIFADTLVGISIHLANRINHLNMRELTVSADCLFRAAMAEIDGFQERADRYCRTARIHLMNWESGK